MLNVISWLINFFSSDTSFQNTVDIIFALSWMYCTRAIYQINSFCQSNILPYFCLSRNRSRSANFLLFERINDTRLSNIWISNETNTYIFFISVENIELSKQINQRSFSEWVWNWRLVSYCWVLLWQILNPFF